METKKATLLIGKYEELIAWVKSQLEAIDNSFHLGLTDEEMLTDTFDRFEKLYLFIRLEGHDHEDAKTTAFGALIGMIINMEVSGFDEAVALWESRIQRVRNSLRHKEAAAMEKELDAFKARYERLLLFQKTMQAGASNIRSIKPKQ